MTRVVLHIDELVLKGFRHEDRHAIADGLSAELTRVLADNPQAAGEMVAMTPGRGHLSRLRLGSVDITAAAKPAETGAQVGYHLARGLTPGVIR